MLFGKKNTEESIMPAGRGCVFFIDYENVHDDGLDGYGELTGDDRVIIFYGTQIKNISFERHIEMMSSKAVVSYIKTGKIAKNYLDFQLTTYLGYIIGQGQNSVFRIISKDTGFDSTVDFWKERGFDVSRQETINGHEIAAPERPIIRKPGTVHSADGKPVKPVRTKKAPVISKKPAALTQNPVNDKQVPESSLGEEAVPCEKPVSSAAKKKNRPNIKSLPEPTRKKIRYAVKSENLIASAYTTIYRIFVSSETEASFLGALTKTFGKEQGTRISESLKEIFCEYHADRKQ